jgi:hypothetical protein
LLIDNKEIREILDQLSKKKYSDEMIAAAVPSSKIARKVQQRQPSVTPYIQSK